MAGAAVVALLLLGELVVTVALRSVESVVSLAVSAVLAAASVGVGLVVARTGRAGLLGPALVAVGGAPVLNTLLDLTGRLHLARGVPLGDHLVAASQGSWSLLYLPVALLLLLYPDGHLLPGRRWRVLVVVAVLVSADVVVAAATTADPFLPPHEAAPHVFGVLPEPWATAAAVLTSGLLVVLVLCAAAPVLRSRRGDAVVRTQVRWLAVVALLLPLTLLGCWLDYLLFGRVGPFLVAGLLLLYLGVPAATAVAVLRHDLADVDRVLAAAVVHLVLTGVLLAAFAATTAVGGLLLSPGSTVAAVAGTAVCAALLMPVRSRLQRLVDARLYPDRGVVLEAVEQLRRHVDGAGADPEQLAGVLRTALRDPGLRLVVRVPGTDRLVDAEDGPDTATVRAPSAGPVPAVPVRAGGQEIGSILAGRAHPAELLRQVASACAPIVEVVRLRLELREALAAVEGSRTRLQRIGYEERRRLERDLHDGAQQRLVSLGMALRLAQRRLGRPGAVDPDALIDHAVAELSTALGELRALAHGLRPGCLDDGLPAALSALAESVPLAIELDLDVDDAPGVGRALSADLQTTAYYVISEAVANAVKHAGASRLRVGVRAGADELVVRVDDDGAGGARPDGSGLLGLADRVSAHGGRLSVLSPPGSGTSVEARLPCGS